MRHAWVKIDVDRLSMRLRVTSGRTISDWDLHRWLLDAGFGWAGGHWYTFPGDPPALLPEEILEKQMRETIDGVTFVDRDVPERPGPRAP